MTETNDEMVTLLKTLVNKIKALEEAVYHKDNILMKSGYVVVESPTPEMGESAESGIESVGKMDWDDIHTVVSNMGGT